MTDTTQFLDSRKALVHSAADAIAKRHFTDADILIIPSEPAPTAPGFALSLARSLAKKVAEDAFASGFEACAEVRLIMDSDKQRARAEEALRHVEEQP